MPHFEINGFHSFFKDKFCSRFKLLSKWLELWTESLIVLHLTNTHSQIYHLLFVLFIIVCRQATFKQVIWRAKQNACHVKVATSFWSWHCFYQQAGHNIVTYTHTHTNHWYTVCVCDAALLGHGGYPPTIQDCTALVGEQNCFKINIFLGPLELILLVSIG